MSTTSLEELSTRLIALSDDRGKDCPYQRMVNELGAQDSDIAKLLSEVVFEPKIAVVRIYMQIKKYGYPIARESITFHRSGICSCNREDF